MDYSDPSVSQTPFVKARNFLRGINFRDPRIIGFGLLILAAIVGVVASRDEKPKAKDPERKPDEKPGPVNVHVHNHGPRVRRVKDADDKPDDSDEKPDDKAGGKTPKDDPPENDGDEVVAK